MTASGAELIRRMAGGDRDAFARFYDRYAPLVTSLVQRIVREPADVKDVLQEVFWEAWRSADSYDAGRGSPEAWILVRARTRAVDRLRAVRRREATFGPSLDEAVAADPAAGADEAATRAEEGRTVLDALAQLSPVQREAIELAYYAGLTQSEIASRLNEPLGTVKTRMRLGLQRLREIVKPAS